MTLPATVLMGIDDPGVTADPAIVERLRAVIQQADEPGESDVYADLGGPTEEEVLAVLAELLPDAFEAHRRAGVPTDITRAGLADVGRKHQAYGVKTLLPWLLGIFRGDVIELGRLQVERHVSDNGHNLHIPEGGPLRPDAVSDSLGQIRRYLGPVQLSCTSWLLDPVLQEKLPDSNIAHFARRFTVLPSKSAQQPSTSGSEAVSKFVFGRPMSNIFLDGGVQPSTQLEHLVVSRLRAGYHWNEPTGVLGMA